jgi:hypothetical protein
MSSWEKEGKNFSKYHIRGKDLQFLNNSKKSDDAEAQPANATAEEVPF